MRELFAIADTIETQPEQMDFESRIYQLIIDIYNESPPVATYHEAIRATTQAIGAGSQTPVVWSSGGSPPLFSFVTVPVSGICTVSANIRIDSAVAGTKQVILVHSGVEIARVYYATTGLAQMFSISSILEVAAGDTFRVDVLCGVASTVMITPFEPKISMVIV